MPVLVVAFRCGGCGTGFTANAYSVPNWRGQPACSACWDRVNATRVALGMPAWEAPGDAYPPVLVD